MIAAWELVVILVAIGLLLLFGPQKIPEIARGIGRAWGEFRKARTEINQEMNDASPESR
ncbi:MAG TPA: twin-arginine translocase TatA/TatE family subunit [Thermoplasmata archaeon]|nr:twin-arginine translocase TatA/TatE family subunit [Thermoplasmata archaeon]HKZ90159.1 twin-arginine translocase TatA/TatE family subunit [Thermoplasmata archaeon]